MTPERKVLLGDSAVAVSVLAPAVLYFGSALVWWVPIPAAFLAFTTAAAQHYTEHVGFDRLRDDVLLSVGAIVVPVAVAAVVTVIGSPLGPPLALAVFAGTGVGFLSYRVVFGVVRPIPDKRLERAGERAV